MQVGFSLESLACDSCALVQGALPEAAPPPGVEWLLRMADGNAVGGGIQTSHARRLLRHRVPCEEWPWQVVQVVPVTAAPSEVLPRLDAPLVALAGGDGEIRGVAPAARVLAWVYQACRRLLAQHETTLDAINDAVTIVSADEQVLGWNWAAERMYGFRREEIMGRPHAEFFDLSRQWCSRVLKTHERVRQLAHRPKDDVDVIINSLPIFLDGEVIGAVSAEQDVTRFVRLQSLLIEATSRMTYLESEVGRLRQVEDPFHRIAGRSPLRDQFVERIRKVAATSATVLIQGESGTGKELAALALHESSGRVGKPFVVINCGAVPLALFESELFGYDGGAFTGASRHGKAGLLEQADGGTLFLDEIGDLPLEMQVKLLRVLEDQSFYRVGGAQPRRVDVRFVAATNRQLEEMIEQGTFRQDLFYRLRVVTVRMPPLRQRPEDLPDLIHLFLQEFSVRYRRSVRKIDPAVMHALLLYSWPGNVRELRNVIEQLVVLADDGILRLEHLPPELLGDQTLLRVGVGALPLSPVAPPVSPTAPPEPARPAAAAPPPTRLPTRLNQTAQDAERQAIAATLAAAGGNKAETARQLGISRPTLYAKLHRLGLWRAD